VPYTHQTAPCDIPAYGNLHSPCSVNLQFHTSKLIKICLSRTKIIYFVESVINVNCCRYQHNSIATRYGLDGSRIESRWGRVFRTCSDRAWSPRNLLHNGYRFFPGDKRTGRGVEHALPFSAEVKEIIELYVYSSCGPSRQAPGWNLSLYYKHSSLLKHLMNLAATIPLLVIIKINIIVSLTTSFT